jgi:hypothetical protein
MISKIVEDLSKGDMVTFFKNSSAYMMDLYLKANKLCIPIPYGKMRIGQFYFMTYKDDSNWMKFSPILLVDVKKVSNKIIAYGINFNFIPLEIRLQFLDKFISGLDDVNQLSNINFQIAYSNLIKWGWEYAIVEYSVAQIDRCYQIDWEILPQFICSAHPKVKYDPKKLYEIWVAKLDGKKERDAEIYKSTVDELLKVETLLSGKYTELEDHIKRVQKSIEKYG